MRFVAVRVEERILALEAQFYRAGRAVAVLGEDELGEVRLGSLGVVVAVAVEKRDDVGFLFEAPLSRRSASIGRFSLRVSTPRLSCASAMIGTPRSFAVTLSVRQISESSSLRLTLRASTPGRTSCR